MSAKRCHIISGGRVVSHKEGKLVVETIIKENDPMPLGFVKFFDTAEVGVVVAPADGGVRVKDAAAGKAFAGAGLREGDLVTAFDGQKVDSPDVFRRLLRGKLAEGGDAVLDVRRAGQVLAITVPCND